MGSQVAAKGKLLLANVAGEKHRRRVESIRHGIWLLAFRLLLAYDLFFQNDITLDHAFKFDFLSRTVIIYFFFVLLLNFYVGSEGTSYWFIPRPLIRLYELKFNVENAVVDRPKDLFAF